MSEGYQIYDQNDLYFLTFQVVDWVDIFTRPSYKKVATDSFNFCRANKGLELYAYVIMTNHIHLLARAKEPNRLSDIIRDYKKFTARTILEMIKEPSESRSDWMLKRFEFAAMSHKRNSEYQIWTHENHAIEISSRKFLQQKMNYIHQNPVRAMIVEHAEDYVFSSASNYYKNKGIIDIDFV